MADINALIAGGIVPLDISGSMQKGRDLREAQLQQEQRNAMLDFLRQNGGALVAGDQNALAQLAGFDPALALGIQRDRQLMQHANAGEARAAQAHTSGMSYDSARLEELKAQGRREAEAHAANMSDREYAKEREEAMREAAGARVAWQQGEAAWERWNDGHPDWENIGWQDAPAAIALIDGIAEGFGAPAPQSSEGKLYADQSAGLVPPGTFEQSTAPQPIIGTPPAGFAIQYDEQNRPASMAPIPGGPAALEAEAAAAAATAAQGKQDVATETIVGAAARAREIASGGGLLSPRTGATGAVAANIPSSQAAELRRQTEVLKAQAKIENLTAMRAASPTGAALGAVSDRENEMLASAAGALDPNARNEDFASQLDRYELTLLMIVHGPAEGARIFTETRAGAPSTGTRLRFNPDTGELE